MGGRGLFAQDEVFIARDDVGIFDEVVANLGGGGGENSQFVVGVALTVF